MNKARGRNLSASPIGGSSTGRTPAFGAGCWRFEPSPPSHGHAPVRHARSPAAHRPRLPRGPACCCRSWSILGIVIGTVAQRPRRRAERGGVRHPRRGHDRRGRAGGSTPSATSRATAAPSSTRTASSSPVPAPSTPAGRHHRRADRGVRPGRRRRRRPCGSARHRRGGRDRHRHRRRRRRHASSWRSSTATSTPRPSPPLRPAERAPLGGRWRGRPVLMTERHLSAVVLAAGEGTRMRSARPKPLHLLCGRAMVLYVLDALPAPESTGPSWWSATAPSGSPRSSPRTAPASGSTSSSRPCSAAPATPSPSGLTGLPDDDLDDDSDVLVLPGDTPLLRARDRSPSSSPSTATPGAACTVLTARLARPHRLRPDRAAARTTASPASSSSATPPPTSSRSTRSTPSIYCFRRSLLAPALRHGQPRQRAGRVLPHRRRRGAGRRRPPGRQRRGRRPRRDRTASTTGPSWPHAEAELRRRTNARWLARASRWSTRPPPTSTPPCRWPPTSPSSPARSCRAAPSIGAGAEIGPGTRLVDCMVGEHTALEHTVARLSRDRRRLRASVPTRRSSRVRTIPPGTRTGPFYTAGADAALDG